MSKETIELNADNTIIVMDTNVWLGLYKIPIPALHIILASLNELEGKIWIPNQVYTEFYRNVTEHKEEFLNKKSAEYEALIENRFSSPCRQSHCQE